MAWTQSDVDALKAAIKTGVLMSRHGETMQTFRSLDEMRETLRMMEAEVAAAAGTVRTRQVRFQTGKGLC